MRTNRIDDARGNEQRRDGAPPLAFELPWAVGVVLVVMVLYGRPFRLIDLLAAWCAG